MPINNITQTISTIPPAGARGVDVQSIFVTKQEDFQDHLQGTTVVELNALVTQQNTMAGAMNSTATQVNTNANTATTQAGIATTKASEASTSASQALTSRNQAETFKNSASTSASTATTKASEASASALSASTSASTATTKASEASASALSASTSAATATTKASAASTSASTATTKASEASASALSASTSAATATTKASEANTSASQALTSRNQAETFAQQASASALSLNANNIVYRTGNQTIDGIKTFSSGIVGSITGNASTATKLATTRNIALSGDVTGDVNFDGTGNVNIATTIAPNSILLGTDTTGNYVAGNTAGTGITVSGTAGEGWSPTISLTNVGAAGTYRSVTTDAQGRVTAGTNPTTLAGYAITDAQTASRTTATFTTVANTWYRIATSAVDIGRNSAEFVVDWTVSSHHGSTRFAAGCHYGEAAGVSLMQTNYSKFGTSGITEARIVYHTTLTGNYAYVEVKFAGALTNVVVNVEMQDTIGWSLVSPSTAGSVPAGYTSYLHTFVPSAAVTAGTYPKVTINQEGRVTSGTTLVAADIPVLDASKITTGTLPIVRGGTGVTTSTGTGNNVLSTSPTLATPNIGVATGTSFNSITGLATVAPLVAGTATVGTSTLTARQDHIHPVQTSVTGNAGTATKLQTARTITLSGDSTGSVTFDGSANANIVVTRSTANMLSDILAVDGAGSGIDADLLDGQHGSYYGTAAAVALNTAKVSNVSTNLSYTTAATTGTVVSSDGTNATIPAATTSLAGLMTNADKTKLDGIASGAQVNVATNLTATAGTTAGPTINSSTGTNVVIPSASATTSGVVTTTTQTIAGVKTFSSSPIVPTPTTGTQAVNKQYVDGKYSGFKNYIINGKKVINQRGLTSTDNSYNQDRWYKSGVNWYQGIEGDNNLISGKTYTLSWVGTATASYYVGTATSSIINVQSFTSITNGGSLTLTITTGQNLWIKFASDATGSTFNYIQLEEGSVATPFENRPYGLELSLCQRYYEVIDVHWQWDGSLGGQATMAIWIGFSTSKRIVPTISIIGSSYLNLQQGGFSATTYGFKSEYSPNSGGAIEPRRVLCIYSTSAEI